MQTVTRETVSRYTNAPATVEVREAYRQAIVTRYHGPTNTRGSRISAQYAGGRIYVAYDHALSPEGNHAAAAATLAASLGWAGRMIGGGSPDGRGNVFVFAD